MIDARDGRPPPTLPPPTRRFVLDTTIVVLYSAMIMAFNRLVSSNRYLSR